MVGGLVHFGRMLDKIRLRQRGELPPDYHPYVGNPRALDGHCCAFLGIKHDALAEQVQAGGSDEELLAWCHATSGFTPTPGQKHIWNEFARKFGWNDKATPVLRQFRDEEHLPGEDLMPTSFDLIDFIEKR